MGTWDLVAVDLEVLGEKVHAWFNFFDCPYLGEFHESHEIKPILTLRKGGVGVLLGLFAGCQ